MIPLISALILALRSALVGFAWGRRVPDPVPDAIVTRAGKWPAGATVSRYELRCGETRIARFASYHKARHAADLNNGAAR